MKNAYVIGHITVKNQEKWAEYRSEVPATLKAWGQNWFSEVNSVQYFQVTMIILTQL
jgi:uncharacterized protein (DUF1330 family)